MRIAWLAAVVALTQAAAPPAAAPPAPPVPREIAAGTSLIPGAMLPERGPDGNTVVFTAPAGLVVVDTGRHPWHSDAILAFAAARRQPITAIVNTHWHLDHSSGNRRLKAAHPEARVYTTNAVDRALAPGGFIARSLASARAQAPDPTAPPTRLEETALFLATMETPQALRPEVAIATSGVQRLAGRTLDVRVADGAVTDADLWIYDESTRVAVIGDLVTLPAPFFETACPARWQAALDAVWATPFALAVPGHGAPMTRGAFDTWRRAFGAFRACVGSDRAPAACAADWTSGVDALLASDDERRQAGAYARYYVEFLRTNGGASPDCRVK
jgi:glyoxylase-like metal-dependent hydrolase (beta-lactamase superfamily II)